MAKAKAKPEPVEPVVRPDGLIETKAKWGQLGIGSVLWINGRKWTVIDAKAPDQYSYGKSNWLLLRAPRGQEYACPPRMMTSTCTVLLEPGATHPPPAVPSGYAEACLLVDKLGATEIAEKDNRTGEIWCKMFPYEPGGPHAAEVYHLEIAHAIDMTGMENLSVEDMTKLHGQCHNPTYPIGKGGFPHRHVPEELEIT